MQPKFRGEGIPTRNIPLCHTIPSGPSCMPWLELRYNMFARCLPKRVQCSMWSLLLAQCQSIHDCCRSLHIVQDLIDQGLVPLHQCIGRS
eukprot:5824574-Amphidinium_carterae.2